MTLNVLQARSHFPALNSGYIFTDNAGGSQAAKEVKCGMIHKRWCGRAWRGTPKRAQLEEETLLTSLQLSWAIGTTYIYMFKFFK
jgi:hypothetical protein